MNATDLTTLASFIARHRTAWDVFCALGVEAEAWLTFKAFGFVQDKGGWILIDNNGAHHLFREYRATIVAIVSPLGNCVLTESGDVVKI